MALILKDFLIRKRADSLPAGSSGFFVRVHSVFLFMLSDGAKIRGEMKQGEVEQEITLIFEKGSCEDFLHICAEDWDDNFTEGRTDLKLTEAFQNGKKR